MKFYELTYLISPDLTEEEINIIIEKTKILIGKERILTKENNRKLLKRRLAYEIQKRNEAYLATLNFSIDQESDDSKKLLDSLEKGLKAEKSILRYLIIRKTLFNEEKKKAKTPKPSLSEVPLKPSHEKTEGIIKKKIKLEEIGEKLEKILKKP